MSGASHEAHEPPTRSSHVGHGHRWFVRAHAVCTDRAEPPRTGAGAVHPVPKSFRIKERQS
jgi:hypothetical protein